MKYFLKPLFIFFIFLQILSSVSSEREWWMNSKALELSDGSFQYLAGHEKYIVVQFYTKWCKYCEQVSEDYNTLADNLKKTRKDIIVARIDGGENEKTLSKYGVYSFPIIALFRPGSYRIASIFNKDRVLSELESWVKENAPEAKDQNVLNKMKADNKLYDEKNKNEPFDKEMTAYLNENKNNYDEKKGRTEENDFVKQGFVDIKQKMDDLEEIGKKLEMRIEKIERSYKARIEAERQRTILGRRYQEPKINVNIDYQDPLTIMIFGGVVGFIILFSCIKRCFRKK